MSQAKVDKHKEDKAHRQKLMKKQKRLRRVETIVIVAVIAAALVWFGVSVYQSNKDETTAAVYMDVDEIMDYMNNPILPEETESGSESDSTEPGSTSESDSAESGSTEADSIEGSSSASSAE